MKNKEKLYVISEIMIRNNIIMTFKTSRNFTETDFVKILSLKCSQRHFQIKGQFSAGSQALSVRDNDSKSRDILARYSTDVFETNTANCG